MHAQRLSVTVPPAERDALLVAVWLHDIGYSAQVRDTGVHGLDGARYLDRHGPDSPQARVHRLRGPHLLAVAERVERRLQQAA